MTTTQIVNTCHSCGYELISAAGPYRGYVVHCPDGAQHLFCDSDCLMRWLEMVGLMSEHEIQRDIAELARSQSVMFEPLEPKES